MDICFLFCCGRSRLPATSARSRTGEYGGGGRSCQVFITLKELHLATNSFNYDSKLGEGGFGTLYWGQLWDGSQIAVKRLKVVSNRSEQEIAGEVEILARVRQKNLANLRGYCAEGQERLIVYEYMPNSSVLAHLHGASECLRDWGRRMSIAIGAAEGIAYLHHHATPSMIHRGIKASNILLDSDFRARVADFGFARLVPDSVAHASAQAHGASSGYLAPENAAHGQALEPSDVYSYGVFLLELASGKKPAEGVVEWALLARERRFGEIADARLRGRYPEGEMKRVVLVGLACAQVQPETRPTMQKVVAMLKGEATEGSIESGERFFRAEDELEGCHKKNRGV